MGGYNLNNKSYMNLMGNAHSKLIEIPILTTDANNPQIKIPDQPDLRFARITSIESIFQSDLKYSQPSGYLNITGTQAALCSLTLETNDPDDTGYWAVNPQTGEPIIGRDGKQIWVKPKNAQDTSGRFTSTQLNQKNIPLTDIHRICNPGSPAAPIAGPDPYVRELEVFYNMYISWTGNCTLYVGTSGLGNTVNQAVCLRVHYSWLDINGMPIPRH